MDPQDVGRPDGPRQTCSVSWDLDPGKLIRPWSADSIKACGRYARAKRPDTWPQATTPAHPFQSPCRPGAIHTWPTTVWWHCSRRLLSDRCRATQTGGVAVIPSNPCPKVTIPLLYSLAILPIAALWSEWAECRSVL